MKSHPLSWLVLFFLASPVTQHASEPSAPAQKLLAEVRSKAETGDAQSEFKLGRVFYFGRLGVTQDYAAAVKWLGKAAEQKYAPAQYALGVCCMNGQGRAKDPVEGAKWFRQAAEQGEARAQLALGGCYFNGEGVARDRVEAHKWMLLAEAQGVGVAAFGTRRLTPEQIAEAEERAKNFKPRTVPLSEGDFSGRSE